MAFIEISSKRFRKAQESLLEAESDEEMLELDCEELVFDEDPILWQPAKKLRPLKPPGPVQLPREVPEHSPPPASPTSPKWAAFTVEQEPLNSRMVVIGRIPVKRKNREPTKQTRIVTTKKANYFFGRRSKPAALTVPRDGELCRSITTGQKCNAGSNCAYIHEFMHIEECKWSDCKFSMKIETGPPVSQLVNVHDKQIYIANNGGKCKKRHPGECVESYLLRLKIHVWDISQLVVRVQEQTLETHLETLLESARACKLQKLTVKIFKPEETGGTKESQDDDSDDSDDEWYSSPKRAL